MMLTEETAVPQAALPVEEMKDHLRMGSGFADDGLQDGLIETYLRAALAAIEGRIGKMLFQRRFLWVLDCWRDAEQALPVSPVSGIVSVTLVGACGTCPASGQTLKVGIERIMRDRVDGVTEVVNVA